MVIAEEDRDLVLDFWETNASLYRLARALPTVVLHRSIPTSRLQTPKTAENIWTVAASNGGALNKSYEFSGGLWRKAAAPPNSPSWSFADAEVPNHKAMVELLRKISRDPQLCLIRGAMHPAADLEKRYRRQWHKSCRSQADGKSGCIIDLPRRWIVIDIDEVKLAEVLTYADPSAIMEWVIAELLPEPLKNVSCSWQLSGSAGLKTAHDDQSASRKVKVHLFLRTKQAIGCRELHCLLSDPKFSMIDRAGAVGTQIIFTACPKLVGQDDPITNRIGFYRGHKTEADFSAELHQLRSILRNKGNCNTDPSRKRIKSSHYSVEPIRQIARPSSFSEYEHQLLKIAYNEMGAHAKGYRNPIFRMVSAAIRNGETNYENLKSELRFLVNARLSELGDIHKANDVERYLSDRELDEAIASSICFWEGII